MRFKTWFENLTGPGGGPAPLAYDPAEMGRVDHKKGVGAFPGYCHKEDPPKPARKSPTAGYLDPRFARKTMKKR